MGVSGLFFSGLACLINQVTHSQRVFPGETFEVEVRATDDDSYELTPVLCAGLPRGWTVLDGSYEGLNMSGAISGELTHDPDVTAAVAQAHPEAESWSCWKGALGKHPAFKSGYGRLTIQVPQDAKGADYTLHWRVGSLEQPDEATETSQITVPYKIYIQEGMLPFAYQTVYMSHQLQAQMAEGDVVWELVKGEMPVGLSVVGDKIQGVPTESGNFPFFLIRATDESGEYDEVPFRMLVSEAPEILMGEFPAALETVAYSASLTSSGGSFDHKWKVIGNLPPGIKLEGQELRGTPTRAGTWAFSLRVEDDKTAYSEREYEISVEPAPTVDTSSGQSDAYQTVPYDHHFSVPWNDRGGVTWMLSRGLLPEGIGFEGDRLFGTPKEVGTFRLTVKATDQKGAFNEQHFLLVVHPAPVVSTFVLSDARVTVDYEFEVESKGGVGELLWETLDDLPPGMTLEGNKLTGTPSRAGSYAFGVKVTDELGAFGKHRLKLVVTDPPTLEPLSLIEAHQTVAFSQSFEVSGALGKVSWEIAEGEPPPGLAVKDGSLSGIPAKAGTFAVPIKAIDEQGAWARMVYRLVVHAAPEVTNQTLPHAREGAPYSARLMAKGGSGSITWNLIGKVPLGIRLQDDRVSGTPRETGTFTIEVKATDAQGAMGTTKLELTINSR
ncbi:MAG: hypothetical protein HN348_17275 [Proteobacteria bacterium]|nr:hypothetical protein [Pseudomonadota bacterium]